MAGIHLGADGLVGYDTALTRQGSRVQFPLRVVVFVVGLIQFTF